MSKFFSVFAIVLFGFSSHAALAKNDKFGALAIDRSEGFYFGWSVDHPSLDAAEQRSLKECEKKGGSCSIVLAWSGKGCGAYRTTQSRDGDAYGWGVAGTRQQADAIATKEAQKRSNGKPTPNHVWGCNSTNNPLVIIKNENAGGSCLIQFEANFENKADSREAWQGRFYSPVYEMPSAHCPLPLKYSFSSYAKWIDADNGKVKYDLEKEKAGGKGSQLADGFHEWMHAQPSPRGTTWVNIAHVHVMSVTDKNLTELTGNINDPGTHIQPRSGLRPACLGYRPPAGEAIKVHGEDKCSSWLK